MRRLAIFLVTVLVMVMSTGLAYSETVLKVTLPKSYEAVFTELAQNFLKDEGIKIRMTSTCSGKAAKEVKDYGMYIDLVISADYTIIDEELIGNKFADWNMLFAKNEMVLGYTNKSKHGKSITASNWAKTVSKKGVKFALSAAGDEPCGYRAMLVLQLAEKYYNMPGFAKGIVDKALYEKKSDIDVVKDLTSNKVDYIVTYKSYAIEHGLKYLELPKEINLFSARYADIRKDVAVDFKMKGMDKAKFDASCIYYSMTIPSTVQHRPEAVKLVKYLKSDAAAKVMEKHGFFIICSPMVTGSVDKLDKPLRAGTVHATRLN
ncbi:MAG: hypothetical protein C0603_00590 [Denitrovibrio sp.]|nr:MAG: hypothetical protein C0603_00590 [Denitrovibrio sp.]